LFNHGAIILDLHKS